MQDVESYMSAVPVFRFVFAVYVPAVHCAHELAELESVSAWPGEQATQPVPESLVSADQPAAVLRSFPAAQASQSVPDSWYSALESLSALPAGQLTQRVAPKFTKFELSSAVY
jgi:hypothetical protein